MRDCFDCEDREAVRTFDYGTWMWDAVGKLEREPVAMCQECIDFRLGQQKAWR